MDNKILDLIKKEILAMAPNAIIRLFGSRARGSFQEDSDYDLLVLLSNETYNPKLKETIEDLALTIGLKEGLFINTIVESKKNWETSPGLYPLYLNVEKEAVVI